MNRGWACLLAGWHPRAHTWAVTVFRLCWFCHD